MRNLWFCIFGCTLIALARAQLSPAEVAVNVTFRDNGAEHNGQNSNLPKLFFKNTPLDVIRVETPPLAPLHVVFVLDSDTHQRTFMKTSLNYVASLAAAMHDSRPEFTIVAAGTTALLHQLFCLRAVVVPAWLHPHNLYASSPISS